MYIYTVIIELYLMHINSHIRTQVHVELFIIKYKFTSKVGVSR